MVEYTFKGEHFMQPQGSKIFPTKVQYTDWITKDVVEIEHRLNLNMEDGQVSSRS